MVAINLVHDILAGLIVFFILLSILNISYSEVMNNLKSGNKPEVKMVISDSPQELENKVKICADLEKIVLDKVGFSYPEKAEFVPLFFFKGMVFPGKAAGQDVIKFPQQGVVTIESIKFPPVRAYKASDGSGGTSGGSGGTGGGAGGTGGLGGSGGSAGGSSELPEGTSIASLLDYTTRRETLLVGFMVKNDRCLELASNGITGQEFSKNCANLVQRTFFLIGKVVNCA